MPLRAQVKKSGVIGAGLSARANRQASSRGQRDHTERGWVERDMYIASVMDIST